MDIAKAAEKGDTTLEMDGLKIFLESRANGMLMNTTIDFDENKGFMLTGTERSSCGTCSC